MRIQAENSSQCLLVMLKLPGFSATRDGIVCKIACMPDLDFVRASKGDTRTWGIRNSLRTLKPSGIHLRSHIVGTGLLAGGTGVTAMINLATVILKNPNDKVKVSQPDIFLLP